MLIYYKRLRSEGQKKEEVYQCVVGKPYYSYLAKNFYQI